MIELMRNALSPLLPLKIRQATFSDPALTLNGDDWGFSSPSAWRVIRNGVLEFGWSDEDAADFVWELCGLSIVSVESQSPRMGGDPAFGLSDGRWLEVFSDHAVDPWWMSLPDRAFVGSPSDPRYTR